MIDLNKFASLIQVCLLALLIIMPSQIDGANQGFTQAVAVGVGLLIVAVEFCKEYKENKP